jgi:RNA polymerase sigma-70 factor (ECF subfamily)
VFGLAMRVLGSRTLAEEITQDVFVHVWEQPDRFDSELGSLRSYLLAMTAGVELGRAALTTG